MHREFAQCLAVARASLSETQNGLIDARGCGYLTASEYEALHTLADRALRATTRRRTSRTRGT